MGAGLQLVTLAGMLLWQVPALIPQAQNGTIEGQLRGPGGAVASGVRVAAMAVPDPVAPAGGGALVSLAQTDDSGRFQLENVPPGRYYIQAGLIDFPSYYPGVASTNGATEIQVTAGARIVGVNFTMSRPPGVRVSGRIPLNVNPWPIRVLMSGGATLQTNNTAIGADGSFEFLRVTPGNYTISASPANGLPSLPIVVSDKDIDLGLPAGPGVKISGVVGLGPSSPRTPNARVVLTGASAWAQVEAVIDASGKFELPVVPAGTYTIRTVPGTSTALSTLVVADRDIAALVLPAFVELAGRVLLDDGSAPPQSSFAIMIEAKRSSGATLATAVRQDGTFRFPLVEGEYRIGIGKLPTGLSVKSVSYGAAVQDLLKSALKLDGQASPAEIRVTLEK